nr:uncharacterized protein LOC107436961 isoform X2 [Parasteatoda tepidariorum]
MASESYPSYFIFLGVILMVATIAQCEDYGLEDNVKELLARRKNLDYVRQLVEDMGNQLNKLQKRNCAFNAGMNDECSINNMNKDLANDMHWLGNDLPGKRKRAQNPSYKDGQSDIGSFLRSMRVLAANHKRR